MSDPSETCSVVLMPSGRRGHVPLGTNLLEAARSLGVELESLCGGRETCGKCQVVIEEGDFPKHAIVSSREHVSPMDQGESDFWGACGPGERRLACGARVLGDVLVTVPEESQAHKQVIAKAATERWIEVLPAVRQLFVKVEPARLDDRRGDWERLKEALQDQWGLADLTIDLHALRELQPALARGKHSVTVTLWQDREVLRIQPGFSEGVLGLAVDVGSTTLAAHLCDLRTGELLSSRTRMNPQVRYGEDLMSRVSLTMMEPRGLQRLHDVLLEAVNALAAECAESAGRVPADILDLVLVGNSVMHHLFLGVDPAELGAAPFALAASGALDLKARDVGITTAHPAARVYILPCIAGQNGADNVAVLLAEAPQEQDELMLIVDVGTNAEIVLGNRNEIWAASSPTGPAFEGAQITHGQRAAVGAVERVEIDRTTLEPRFKVMGADEWVEGDHRPALRPTGICGSGIIEAIADMFLAGILDSNGRFVERAALRSSRVRFHGRAGEYLLATAAQTATGSPITISQNDVRAVQLAKAALYAGVKLLMARCGARRVDRVALAGAFGSYLSPRHALVLGLIPDCDLSRVAAVGNAAGDGARMALLNREKRAAAERLARAVRHVSLAIEPEFQQEFVAAMAIPHARDEFPHLQGILPAPRPASSRERRRQRVPT